MHPITTRIAALHRRLVWRERAVAVCSTLAVVLAATCALGFVDYWFRLRDRGLRVMLSAAVAGVAAWAVYRWWIVPHRRRSVPLAVAQHVEARFPELQDRLASSLEFLEQSEDDATAGSPALRRAVVNQTELELAELPIESIVDYRSLRRASSLAAIVGAIAVGCAILNSAAVGTAVVRLLAPWGGADWPRANHLAFRDPPTRLAVGQTFEVELIDTGGSLPDEVRIEYRFLRASKREIRSEWMNRTGDVMVARRENVREPFAFRAEGGDDDTLPWMAVEVVEPPQLESLAVTVHPPEYTGLPVAPAQRHLVVLAGTSIEVVGRANKPLCAARFVAGKTAVDAVVRDDVFSITAGQWIAVRSGQYRLELAGRDGVTGTAGEWTLRVEPDAPPTVTWKQPHEDLFVLPTATVPIAATANDNLAVARVDLQFTRSDEPDADASTIELYRGPERPNVPNVDRGDMRTVEYAWPLAPLALPAGTELTLNITAADYQPGTGKSLASRRITIVSRDELDARLADRQAQIARRLEEALALQRKAREDVQRLAIQLRDAGELDANSKDVLQATELNQRRVDRLLVHPADSALSITEELAGELRINGIDNREVERQVEALKRQIGELSVGPLAAADQSLTSARKLADADTTNHEALASALDSAGVGQEASLAVLEQLVREFTGSADYERLVRDLARLRDDQLAHRKNTRNAIGLDTLPLELSELSRQQLASLNQAAVAEESLAGRYERMEQEMDSAATAQDQPAADIAARLADAVALARQLAIGGSMRQAQHDLANNRVGQALARETMVADAIEQVLDVLRNRAETRPEELIGKLRAAERRLTALREELVALRAQAAEAVNSPGTAMTGSRQQQLRRDIARLARELERLEAGAASRSTHEAGEQLADSAANDGQPASGEQLERAEQRLAEAAEQLAARRQQAEEEWARAFLDRFQVELTMMIDTQRDVIQRTLNADAHRGVDDRVLDAERQTLAALSGAERKLAEDASVQRELLTGLRVFGVALADAAQELTAAADMLDDHATGAAAQQAERRALERFEQIAQALEQTSAAANTPSLGGQGGGDGGAKRPLFDLFEVKLLRTLQADLHERTQAFQKRRDGEESAARQRAAEDLAAEQGGLAELVEELLSRNNDSEDGDESD